MIFKCCEIVIFEVLEGNINIGLFGLHIHFVCVLNSILELSLCQLVYHIKIFLSYIYYLEYGSFEGQDRHYLVTRITARPIGRAAILVIMYMYVESFETDVIVFIDNVITCLTSH